MNKLSFTITQGKFFTVVYRLSANQLYRLAPGSDTLQ